MGFFTSIFLLFVGKSLLYIGNRLYSSFVGKFNPLNVGILNDPKNAVIFAFIYKAREAWAYNIASEFDEAIKSGEWNRPDLNFNSFLVDGSNTKKVLNDLIENRLIIPSQIRGQMKPYRINPYVFVNEEILYHPVIKDTGKVGFNLHHAQVDPIMFSFLFWDYYCKVRANPIPKIQIIRELNGWKKYDFFMLIWMVHNEIVQKKRSSNITGIINTVSKIVPNISWKKKIFDVQQLVEGIEALLKNLKEDEFLERYFAAYLPFLLRDTYRLNKEKDLSDLTRGLTEYQNSAREEILTKIDPIPIFNQLKKLPPPQREIYTKKLLRLFKNEGVKSLYSQKKGQKKRYYNGKYII